MNKYLYIFVSIFFLFTSCSERLPEQKMIDILSDIYISDATTQKFEFRLGESMNRKSDSTEYYSHIFKNYNTDRDKFTKSFLFYAQNPKKMDKLYDKVRKNVESMKEPYIAPAREERLAKNLWVRDTIKINSLHNFYTDVFSTKLIDTGVYTISMQILFDKKDSTVNPFMTSYMHLEEDTIKRDTIKLVKDSIFRQYEMNMHFSNHINNLDVVWIGYDSVKIKKTPVYGYKNKKRIKLRDSISGGGQHLIIKDIKVKYNKELSLKNMENKP